MDIRASNIEKFYGNNQVLNIDELTIKKGILTGISGPNGCGKSTLLNIIAGLDSEFEGSIKYNGLNLDDDLRKHMTLVTQKPYLFKRSVFDNLAYPLRIRNYKKEDINIKVNDMLRRMGIYNLKDNRADKLSGGESQKVSLARGLIFNPRLLMLDEPTSNIDLKAIRVMEKEILNYLDGEGTVIMVTHDEEQAERLCDVSIHMNRGEILRGD